MKIFVSHSSLDKWIAHQIAAELEARTFEVFLDEKDIVTGDPIENTVRSKLQESDELLLLLTPASLNSPWVLIEVGGAQALGKRVVPILHHVAPNELPTPIASALARDLNDIERYYSEAEARSKMSDVELAYVDVSDSVDMAARPGRTSAPAIGDRIKIPLVKPHATVGRDGRDIGWNPYMSDLLGLEGTVLEFDESSGVVRLDIDHGRFLWLADWLVSAAS